MSKPTPKVAARTPSTPIGEHAREQQQLWIEQYALLRRIASWHVEDGAQRRVAVVPLVTSEHFAQRVCSVI
jgi:hypothetical protein